ncbi:MAG: hypothetical protein M3O62_10190 [Pseudomonadota bacterium]|nr:hypothetical protein [Pseudomonadota bacterium]
MPAAADNVLQPLSAGDSKKMGAMQKLNLNRAFIVGCRVGINREFRMRNRQKNAGDERRRLFEPDIPEKFRDAGNTDHIKPAYGVKKVRR